jgi:hypothetical protein
MLKSKDILNFAATSAAGAFIGYNVSETLKRKKAKRVKEQKIFVSDIVKPRVDPENLDYTKLDFML